MASQVSSQSAGRPPASQDPGQLRCTVSEEAAPPCPRLQLALGQVLPRTGSWATPSFLTNVMAPPEPTEGLVQGLEPGNPSEAEPSGCCPAEQQGRAKDVQETGPPCSETASLIPGALRHTLARFGNPRPRGLHEGARALPASWEAPRGGQSAVCGCHSERLTLIRTQDAWRAAGGLRAWGQGRPAGPQVPAEAWSFRS